MSDLVLISRLAYAYLIAKEYVIKAGYLDELNWQESRDIHMLTEQSFLRESAWVILSGGMRETIIQKCFPKIAIAFLEWQNIEEIVNEKQACVIAALETFNHPKKINAIATVAEITLRYGISEIKKQLIERGINFLKELPYIGSVTSFHLAKNLGLNVVKPDRHIMRITKATGLDSPEEMCYLLSANLGDSIALIDIVLWRFATLRPDYTDLFHGINTPKSLCLPSDPNYYSLSSR